MIGIGVLRWAIVAMIAIAAGCGYDSSAPDRDSPPPVPDANDGLWISSASDPAILRLAPAQLLSGGRQAASATITTSSATLFTLNSIAFDTAGTMWIASANDSLVLAFSPEILAASGLRAASTVIAPTDRSLSLPSAIAFDRLQRLWVANLETGTIVRFDRGQLASDGAPRPTVIISGLSRPAALAFDASGSLWVANSRGNTVVKFSAAQLDVSGAPTPQVVLSAVESSLSIPFALAFDAFGNLWVANVGKSTIVAFSPEQLTATGSPAPRIQFSSRADSFGTPIGLAFDAEGSLWVVGDAGALDKFAREQLSTAGEPEPSAQLSVNGHTLLSGIAFWPTPLGLPIN